MRPLDGKKALVTGGSRGVGKAVALELAELGADVAVVARTAAPRGDDLEGTVGDTAAAIESTGSEALPVIADLLRPGEVERVASTVLARFSRLDILVNNAADTGDNVFRGFWDTDTSEWEAQIQLNLNVGYAMMKSFAPTMRTNGGGLIVNMGSMQGVPPGLASQPPMGLKLGAAYPTSKVALYTMSTLIAQELAEDGIVVCTVNPGGAASEMHYHHMSRLGIPANPTPLALPVKTIGYIATCADPERFAGAFVDAVSFATDNGLAKA